MAFKYARAFGGKSLPTCAPCPSACASREIPRRPVRIGEHFDVVRHVIVLLLAVAITDANLDRLHRVEAVEFVTARSSMPLTIVAWRVATESNQPQRRARPVVAPNSRPMRVQHVGNLRVLRRQRPFAHARGVGLHHADDAVHAIAAARRSRCKRRPPSCSTTSRTDTCRGQCREKSPARLRTKYPRRGASPGAAERPCS